MHYHLVGSEGISMRGIGEILKQLGHTVTGSDLKLMGHSRKNISKDIDVIVRTSAVSPGSPGWEEIEEGERLNIKILKRSEIISELTSDKYLITISGMHGKTTVTSLIGLMLIEAGLDPTVLVGEEVQEFNGVVRIGSSKYFVMEACEYDKSFLDFYPEIAVITNIDKEHLDTYPNGIPDILTAFKSFIGNIKKSGTLVYCSKDKYLPDLVNEFKDLEKIPYGDDNFDYEIKLLGSHNKLNAQAAIACAKKLDVGDESIRKVLASFSGAHRRLELKGDFNAAKIYDDYGHHPTEISATIDALKQKYPDKKLMVVFWPHQYKRILPLLPEFVNAFDNADEVILKPIFLVPGRDEKLDISSEKIIEMINEKKKIASVMEDDDEIINYLKNTINDSYVVLTIGIPPVYKIAEKLIEEK